MTQDQLHGTILIIKSPITHTGDNEFKTNVYQSVYLDTQQNVSTNITFFNLDSDDPTDVTISISMEGENFGFKANLSYYDDVLLAISSFFRILCTICTFQSSLLPSYYVVSPR